MLTIRCQTERREWGALFGLWEKAAKQGEGKEATQGDQQGEGQADTRVT